MPALVLALFLGTAAVARAAQVGVQIVNFRYDPNPTTVRVGDTVTWTNQDDAPHTATASNGAFDTGTLRKGESGSFTAVAAGTFEYICSIHPFMRATLVVQAPASAQPTAAPRPTTAPAPAQPTATRAPAQPTAAPPRPAAGMPTTMPRTGAGGTAAAEPHRLLVPGLGFVIVAGAAIGLRRRRPA